MRLHALTVIGAVALIVTIAGGCATGEISRVGTGPRLAITNAATAEYPGDPIESDSVLVTAVNDPGRREVVLYNVGPEPIPRATVWVNGTYLQQINGIATRGSAVVEYENLLEAGSGVMDLREAKQPVRRVEIETIDGLYTVQGPVVRSD